MSLTYQPFAQTPEVEQLRTELRKNDHSGDAAIAAMAGGVLLLAGLSVSGLLRLLLVIGGGAMLRSAWQKSQG